MISAWLGSLGGLYIGTNVGNELGLYGGKVLEKKLGALDWISLGTYYSKVLRYLEALTEVTPEVNLMGLLLGYWLGSVVRLLLGFNKGTVRGFWDGKVLGRTSGALVGL